MRFPPAIDLRKGPRSPLPGTPQGPGAWSAPGSRRPRPAAAVKQTRRSATVVQPVPATLGDAELPRSFGQLNRSRVVPSKMAQLKAERGPARRQRNQRTARERAWQIDTQHQNYANLRAVAPDLIKLGRL